MEGEREQWREGGMGGGRRVRKRDTVRKDASVAILTGLGAGLRSEPLG